jgi:hypothetical protein
MKKIKSLYMAFGVDMLTSFNGEITEFWKQVSNSGIRGIHYDDRDSDGQTNELWYRQGNREINNKYVVEIEYEEEK